MTSDNISATLIDDSCFSDIFTMQSQTLDDFEFGLEATNVDNLLELFEEREKEFNNISNNFNKNNLNFNDMNNKIIISSPKVRKSTNSSSDISNKKRGTSLLAKPKKTNAITKKVTNNTMISINGNDFQPFSSHLLQEHDYCLISEDSKQLYNKLPNYLTDFTNISKDDGLANIQENNTFDKIPNYIKGFLNLNDNINEREDNFICENSGNILIELNDAYIEVSDVFFDNQFISNDHNCDDISLSTFDSNNDLTESSSSSLTPSEKSVESESNELNEKHLLPQNEQKDNKNTNNYNIINDKKPIARKSRSRSRETRTKQYVSNTTRRRRRLSTRSSVDSSSESSRSSSCSSCSSYTSYSCETSDDSKINYKISKSIIRNDSTGHQFNRKRSLKESFCQNNYRSKNRSNFENKSCNEIEIINHMKSRRNSVSLNVKKDIEERKIIYVGKIPDETTKSDVRHWFGRFGSIKEVSIHFRDFGDNYAFVTFFRRSDAFEAIEHANEDSRHPKFDLSFGGRRQFCKTNYQDLDYVENDSSFNSDCMDFDALLRSTQAKLNR